MLLDAGANRCVALRKYSAAPVQDAPLYALAGKLLCTQQWTGVIWLVCFFAGMVARVGHERKVETGCDTRKLVSDVIRNGITD